MGKDKDRELTLQPLANSTQPQAQSYSNKLIYPTLPCSRPKSLSYLKGQTML